MNTPTTTSNSVRPWQGTFLGVVNIIGLVLVGLGVLLLAGVMFGLSAGLSGMQLPMLGFLGEGFLALLFVIAAFVIGIFLTIGIFKGQKWAIYVGLAFTALNILQILFTGFNLFSLVINGFIAWLEYSCLIHPYYK